MGWSWAFWICALFFGVDSSYVVRTSRGYERIVVAISHRVNQDQCQYLLENLQALLSQTSLELQRALHGKAQLQHISVLLPTNWNLTHCGGGRRLTTSTYHNFRDADIHIERDHIVHGATPWTLQYGGCTSPGKYIYLPTSFLMSATPYQPDLAVRARLLVREWAKYRYGVFDEMGFEGDLLYPAQYPEGSDVRFTNCHDPSSNISDNVICSESEDCNEPHGETSKAANRSLMSSPLSAKITDFCDNATHVVAAPTKHNFLCDGKSVWEVISQHPDFTQKPVRLERPLPRSLFQIKTATGPTPEIDFVVPKINRYILLLDGSKEMGLHSRWTYLSRALFQFIHLLPSSSELAIVTYTNQSVANLPLTTVTAYNRDGLYGGVPPRPFMEDGGCLSCAFQSAKELVKENAEALSSASIILVTGSPQEPKDFDKLIKTVRDQALKVNIIAFSPSTFPDIQKLSMYGSFYIMQEPDPKPFTAQMYLAGIFREIIRADRAVEAYKILHEEHYPNAKSQSEGVFVMEDSLGKNTWVTVHSQDVGDVKGLQLTSPSGKLFDLSSRSEGLVFHRIPGVSEPGVWTYTIKFYQAAKLSKPVVIEAITEIRDSDAITVRAWSEVQPLKLNKFYDQVAVYAEVLQGQYPVLNATVVAVIQAQDDQAQHKHEIIRLFDNGNTGPDLTAGDGIYSAYFTFLMPKASYYTVLIHASDSRGKTIVPILNNDGSESQDLGPCCGSEVPYKATIPTSPFGRFVVAPSFYVQHGVPAGEDPYPPNRVTDLIVEKVNEDQNEVILSWTAPGGDFNIGKASRYEMRCHTTREGLTDANFQTQGIPVHFTLLPLPKQSGTRQNCTVGVPWPNELFFYAIIAIDDVSNKGKVSNLATTIVRKLPPTTINSKNQDLGASDVSQLSTDADAGGNSSGIMELGKVWFKGFSETEVYAITGGAAGFFLLIITLILVLVFVQRARNSKKNTPPCPIYEIHVNNAYIQEDDKQIKIIGSNGKVLPRGGHSSCCVSFWSCCKSDSMSDDVKSSDVTTQRSESYTPNITVASDHSENSSSAPPASIVATSPYRQKMLTNGSIMREGNSVGDISAAGLKSPQPEAEHMQHYGAAIAHGGRYTPSSNVAAYLGDTYGSGFDSHNTSCMSITTHRLASDERNDSRYGHRGNVSFNPETCDNMNASYAKLPELQKRFYRNAGETSNGLSDQLGVGAKVTNSVDYDDDGGFKNSHRASFCRSPPPHFSGFKEPPPYSLATGNMSSSGYGSNSSIHFVKKKRHISFV